jgi:glycosyltransferase involved in cell wall biosynthesis
VDEDYGMVPYEAFMAEKPVVTTHDAGAPLDVVHDRETGLVTAPRADELARAFRFLLDNETEARAWGQAGRAIAEQVTWERVIQQLLP